MLDCSSAKRQNQRFAGSQAGNRRVLALPKSSFAVTGKELGDGHAGLGCNHVVHIDKAPSQSSGEQRTDRALARPHEPGKNNAAR
jgi:hypothetical protein